MEDEQAFEALFRRLGLSVDWSLTYATVGEQARRASQRAFLRLLAKGLAYQADAPTLWEVDFHTAVAQAELEDREVEGMSYRLRFADGGRRSTPPGRSCWPPAWPWSSTPTTAASRDLLGTTVRTPLFGAEVPVLAHRLADPGKGTGHRHALHLRRPDRPGLVARAGPAHAAGAGPATAPSGRSPGARPGSVRRPGGRPAGPRPAGRPDLRRARERVAAMLRQAGALAAPPARVTQTVKFYEHGSQPVEILTSRQWFVRTVSLKDALLARGSELSWQPEWMRSRFQNWVTGSRPTGASAASASSGCRSRSGTR